MPPGAGTVAGCPNLFPYVSNPCFFTLTQPQLVTVFRQLNTAAGRRLRLSCFHAVASLHSPDDCSLLECRGSVDVLVSMRMATHVGRVLAVAAAKLLDLGFQSSAWCM